MVGGGDHRALCRHAEGVVCLRAAQPGKAEAGAELDALDRRDGKGQVGNFAFHTVKVGLADSGGQAEDGSLQHAAHAVALGTGGADGGFHGLLHGGVQHRKALGLGGKCPHLCRKGGGVVQRKGRICKPCAPGDVGGDINARPLQCGQHDAAARHKGSSHPAGKVPAAPGVLKAVVLGIGGKVRVAGAQKVGGLGVVRAAGVLVFDHQGDGGAGGVAVHHTGQQLHRIRLHTGGGKAVAPGTALIHAGGEEALVHRHTGGHAVQHRTYGAAVALAEDGQRKVAAKGIFHGSVLHAQQRAQPLHRDGLGAPAAKAGHLDDGDLPALRFFVVQHLGQHLFLIVGGAGGQA